MEHFFSNRDAIQLTQMFLQKGGQIATMQILHGAEPELHDIHVFLRLVQFPIPPEVREPTERHRALGARQ